jgi:hypothetical protein
MQISRICRIAKDRAALGGYGYLFQNIVGYPLRRIENSVLEKKRKQLLNMVEQTKLPVDLKLNTEKNPEVIVSVTSYPKRLKALPLCIKSILMQTVLPDRIVIYLGSDTQWKDIPQELLDYQKYGVEIYIDDTQNLKPHKKYYYALQRYPEANVITVDDDLVYPQDMIADLLNANKMYPNAVCARRVHKITFNKSGNINPYVLWKKEWKKNKQPSNCLLGTGCGGILYPPQVVDKRAFDADAIINCCLEADDIWLKCMEVLANRKVLYVPSGLDFAVVPDTQATALKNDNIGMKSLNDKFLISVMNKYGICSEDFKE